MHGLPVMELRRLSRLWRFHHVCAMACFSCGSIAEVFDCACTPKAIANRNAVPTVTHAL
jgi:hypothetical protein